MGGGVVNRIEPLNRLRFAIADAKNRRLRTAAEGRLCLSHKGRGKKSRVQRTATFIAAPSPLVGEGITGVSPALDAVRGCPPDRTPHPSAFGCHPLPQGGGGRTSYRSALRMAPSRPMVPPL